MAIWRDDGLTLPVWWRDDDAAVPTPALDHLLNLSRAVGIPVHLAVIPADAGLDLAALLAGADNAIPVVHGWAHENHAPQGQKKAEFGGHRPLEVMQAEIGQGLAKLQDLFGDRLSPIFVPPWNRVSSGIPDAIAQVGFKAISTYLPRIQTFAAPGLKQINTHIDPIFWRGHRGLVDPDTLLAQLVALLRDRRQGHADNAEPLGYLTHHLVHDDDIWDFSLRFWNELAEGPITPWRMDLDTDTEEVRK
ncbi:polysaccharide deacetylase family protein [Shimia biformata]|uniref:polysaccharide deacetylase family protein n=1 Tax=Shimia biformata TaxID=1294299 RepID=UPI001EF20162|nr:polysaccharide deacetylase family protein [Shimia biformata]